MLKPIRILIADDNIDLVHILIDCLSIIEGFEIVGTAYDGLEAVDKIKDLQPNMLLLDMVMPHLGGMGVLKKMDSLINYKPQVIMLTAMGLNNTTQLTLEFGADFLIQKPFDIDELVFAIHQINDIRRTKQIKDTKTDHTLSIVPDIMTEIKKLINVVGVPSHLKGYYYILFGIEILLNDLSAINSITNQIYERISQKFATTSSRVERSIRNAIELTWSRGNIDILEQIFGYDQKGVKLTPSNSEFLIKIANELLDKPAFRDNRLDYGRNNIYSIRNH